MRVLVIGGTGNVGSQVTQGLLQAGAGVRVMTRSADKTGQLPAGVEAVVGDLTNSTTLPAAFAGTDAVFLVTALSQTETHEGLAAVAAAKAARVRKLVYMSVHQVDTAPHIPHFASKIPVEYAVRESGIPYTLLRPNNFYQVDLWLREALLNYGVYPQPIGRKGVSRVDVRDIADVAVAALTGAGHQGKTYALVGPEALTGESVAEVWSRHLGRPVQYLGDDLDVWAQQAKSMLPEWLVVDLCVMFRHFQQHGLAATGAELDELRRVLGREPRRFEDFVAETAHSWGMLGRGGD
jgi:uncharacterized protein YbjT (DUF2867 family)